MKCYKQTVDKIDTIEPELMTEIYAEIAKLSDKFRTMAYGLYSKTKSLDE